MNKHLLFMTAILVTLSAASVAFAAGQDSISCTALDGNDAKNGSYESYHDWNARGNMWWSTERQAKHAAMKNCKEHSPIPETCFLFDCSFVR